ncbi:MAG: hypothetical protein WCT18_03870 [Patescibacteria group bacterium]
MEQIPTIDNKTVSLFRPREIISNPANLRPEVGLFGTCGSPASTWRQDIFIPELKKRSLAYFNPQVGPGEWTPEMAKQEAEHLANDEVLVFPISKETSGYGSLGEAGWAILSALLRGQKLGIFVEEDDNMPEDTQRARTLFKLLATQIQQDYPVFHFENTLEDLAQWAAITMKDRVATRNSKIKETRIIKLPTNIKTQNNIAILGTSSPTSKWKQKLKETLDNEGIAYFDPYKENWTKEDGAAEITHKTGDKVLLQIITGETESFGSIAESGLLALSAFVRGQAYGLFIEDHPSSPKSETNRARSLVKAHVKKLIDQFPGIVFLADSIEELQKWAIKTAKMKL